MRERRPAWLRRFAPDGNLARLVPVRCRCGLWVIEERDVVWEVWDAGILSGEDVVCAILLRRPLLRVEWRFGQPVVSTVWGERGLDPAGSYLAGHVCGRGRIGDGPFRPPRTGQGGTRRWWDEEPSRAEVEAVCAAFR